MNDPIPSKQAIRQALPLVLVSLLCVAIQLMPASIDWLQFSRSSIASGEVWRLFSASLIHTNFSHLMMNLAGLLITWLMFHQVVSAFHSVFVVMLLSAMVSLGLIAFYPEVSWYVGMSGALHGLFSYSLLREGITTRPSNLILSAGLIVKLWYEQWFGASEQVEQLIGANVLTSSHLVGAISGGLLALLLWVIQHRPIRG